MLKEWLTFTKAQLKTKEYFHVSGKRISRNVQLEMPYENLLKDEITLDMLGFSKRKISMLTEYYLNEESVRVAKYQLENRIEKGTYGSVGVSTYNHFAKKERPMHGPCIQSVVLTHAVGGKIDIDVFYRTTEVFKKFAADLIWLRTVFLPQLPVSGSKGKLRLHFANTTFHPMYWAVSAPHLQDPVADLNEIYKLDKVMWKGIIRWTYRYVTQPESLQKFKQAFRVSKHMKRLTDPKKMKVLEKYILSSYKSIKKPLLEEPDDDE